LTTGHERHDVIPASELVPEAVEVLLARGIISIASGPPLVELPGWKVRGRVLAAAGIETINALLDAEHEEAIIAAFQLKKRSTIERWRREALSWLKAPATNRNCGRC